MKNIIIPAGKSVTIIESRKKKKLFCYYGLNGDNDFEVGSITAYSKQEADTILKYNKKLELGGVYSIKEIDSTKEFDCKGILSYDY